MSLSYSATELYQWIENKTDCVFLDVRNEEDHKRFMVEGPNQVDMRNIPYFDFIETPVEAYSVLEKTDPIRVICAKEGSAQFVADILESAGFHDVMWLQEGIISWGNVLIPKQIPSDSEYEIWQFNRPGKASCSYGLIFEGQMMIFDPSRNIEFYKSFAESSGAKITHVFETHLQADYISGGPRLTEETGATYLAHEGDYAGTAVQYSPIIDGEQITFEEARGPKVLCTHSPGHTPGSTTYVIDEKFMVSGDTVFIVSIGRPDLGKKVVEWAKQLYNTLKMRIAVLPDELLVLPGHYTDWDAESDEQYLILNDFGTVKSLNEEIYGITNEEQFVEYIIDNMREQPAVYDEIRKVNAGWLNPDEAEQDIMDLGKNECAASHMVA